MTRALTAGFIVALLLSCSPALAQPAANAQATAPRSPRNANYQLSVTLDPATRTLRATGRIEWRNITRKPTGELQFHLYWNAWTDGKSTWMRENAASRPMDRPNTDFSRFTLESLQLEPATAQDAATNLLPTLHYLSPDDGNADDRTVMRVPLPRPARPGDTVVVTMSWTARVPRTFDRTGTIGRYYFIAQWFPKLGVLEDSGWNTHQFHAMTEFFSDYGVYDVSITVPKSWVVGASGTEQSRTEAGATATHRFVAEDVHDFAWTASPDFLDLHERFEADGLPPVDMRLLLQPEHRSQAARHFAAARTALKHYGTWFGAYPYGYLTIVDPAYQSNTGGMEYPTLFTVGTSWLVAKETTLSTPEETAVHEAGHQFWYGISGTNEFEHAWMDEGINTFATARAMAADYPQVLLDRYYFGGFVPWVFRDVRYRRETDIGRMWGYRQGATDDTIANLTYRQRPDTVRTFAYDKPSVWLNTLERWLGWPVLQQALARTFTEGAFGHPTPEQALANLRAAVAPPTQAAPVVRPRPVRRGRRGARARLAASAMPTYPPSPGGFGVASPRPTTDDQRLTTLNRFLDQTFTGSAVFDYAVSELDTEPVGTQTRSTVTVRRLGDGVFPVDMLVTFENGEQARETWDGVDRWKQFTYTKESGVVSAVVDPDQVLLLDTNFTNNSRTMEPKTTQAARKWTLKWMVWLQDALLTLGLFA